jgi:choline transport protein
MAPSINSATEYGTTEYGKDIMHPEPPTAYDEELDGQEYHNSLRGHTKDDRADMARMGKVQELRRNYRPLSALAFTVILQGTWEVLMTCAL